MNMTNKYPAIIAAAGLLLLSSSCRKTIENLIDKKADTVYDTLTVKSQARIISFQVNNVGEYPIIGSLDDTQGSITVYLPYYYQLLYMEPSIILPEGSTISPAADALVPVFAASPFSYTVTAKSGLKKTYTVKTVTQQPVLFLNELSGADRTASFAIPATGNATLGLTGTNILPSYAVTSVYLMDAAGNQVYQLKEYAGSGYTNTGQMTFAVLAADRGQIQTGTDYWLEMRSYALKYRLNNPIRFTKP